MADRYEATAYLYDVNTVLFGVRDNETDKIVREGFPHICEAEWEADALNGREDMRGVSVSFAPGARCSDLDAHPFSGAVSAEAS